MTHHIGIYTGTFDPLHAGHITFGEQAALQCGLHSIILIPEKTPRNKPQASDISRRLSDARNATMTSTLFQVATLASAQFTVAETLPELQQLYPDVTFTFLFGSDVVRTFGSTWQQLEQLLSVANLAIGLRGNDTRDNMENIIKQLEKTHAVSIKRTYIRTPHAHVSSSHIRQTNLMRQKTL